MERVYKAQLIFWTGADMVTLPALIPRTQIHCCLQQILAVKILQIPATHRFHYTQLRVKYIPVFISLKILRIIGLNLKSAIDFPLGYINFLLTSPSL